jgi:hypothetical protein
MISMCYKNSTKVLYLGEYHDCRINNLLFVPLGGKRMTITDTSATGQAKEPGPEQLDSDLIALRGYIREGNIDLFLLPEDILSIPLFHLGADQHELTIGESGLFRVEIKASNAMTGMVQVHILEVIHPFPDDASSIMMLDGCAAMLTIYPEDRMRFEAESGL